MFTINEVEKIMKDLKIKSLTRVNISKNYYRYRFGYYDN